MHSLAAMLTRATDYLKDLRFGLRMLRRSPVFAAVAVLSLALGIGGSAAVFALINAIVLRQLPVPRADRLFVAARVSASASSPRFAWRSFERTRDRLAGRAEAFAVSPTTSMQLRADGGEAGPGERGIVQLVSGEYFPVLQQRPQLGRLLGPSDNRTVNGHPVAVISDGYWRRQFATAGDIVGRTLGINGTTFTIVGVTAPGFFGTTVGVRMPDVWIPVMMQPQVRYSGNASSHGSADTTAPWPPQETIEWLNVFARVPDGTDPVSIASGMTAQLHADADTHLTEPDDRERVRGERIALNPAATGISSLRDSAAAPLYVLLSMMGVLLLIACGNVAGLLVARASAREREMAIRVSLGAGRARLLRQLLIESLLLGVLGGLAGLGLAMWGRDLLLALFVRGATIVTLDTGLDARVLTFALAVSLVTGVLCGVLPAVRSIRVPISESLKMNARTVGTDGRRTLLLGKLLVGAQMAFCLLLLVVAALFGRSLRALAATDIGFDRAHVLAARVDVRSLGYSSEQRDALYRRVIERVSAIPGVESSSLSLNGPLANSSQRSSFQIDGYTPAPGEQLVTHEEYVTDRYFATVGLRIVRGRGFNDEDRVPGSRATLINETMARRFYSSKDPVGGTWGYDDNPAEKFVVVGVVEDARYLDVREPTPPMAYHPSLASPDAVLSDLEVRVAGNPGALTSTLRQVLAESEPLLPVFDVVPLGQRVTRNISQDAVVARLTSVFGGVALLLACLGLYGTISYGVSQRISELGLRLALGAERRQVQWLVMREALLLVVVGGVIGLPLAYGAARALASLLYGIAPVDPFAYAAGSVVLFTVALLAAWLPAHRASRVEPMVALGRS